MTGDRSDRPVPSRLPLVLVLVLAALVEAAAIVIAIVAGWPR